MPRIAVSALLRPLVMQPLLLLAEGQAMARAHPASSRSRHHDAMPCSFVDVGNGCPAQSRRYAVDMVESADQSSNDVIVDRDNAGKAACSDPAVDTLRLGRSRVHPDIVSGERQQ